MLILAIDTSCKEGSVALARGDAGSFDLIESAKVEGGTFSAQLVPQIAKMLSHHNLKKQQIDGFAAASGPGSFTGLRVGLAGVKALAEVLKKPIVAVSVLQTLARSALSPQGAWEADVKANLLAILDAGRGEAYAAEYRFGSPLPVCVNENLLQMEEVAALVEQRGQKLAVITPDAALITTLQKLLSDPKLLWSHLVAPPAAAHIAELGLHKLLRGETVSVEVLDANYMRSADAHIASPRLPLQQKAR